MKATTKDAETFDTLVNYLKQSILETSREHAQLLLARGLLSWIGHAQTRLIRDGPSDSPFNLVSRMVNKTIRHADVYNIFCK